MVMSYRDTIEINTNLLEIKPEIKQKKIIVRFAKLPWYDL